MRLKTIALAILLSLGLVRSVAAENPKFPITACYASNRSWGPPLLDGNGDVDPYICSKLARYQRYTIEVDPAYSSRPDIVTALRSYNPHSKLLAYTLTGYMWVGPEWTPPANDSTYGTHFWKIVHDTDGFLYGQDSLLWLDNYNVNLGKRLTTDSLQTLWSNVAASTLFDGIFLDDFSAQIAWTDGSGGRHIDYARAGFTSLAQMDSARAANCTRIITAIRAAAPGKVVIANGTTAAQMGLEGWMREGVGTLVTYDQARVFADTAQGEYNWLKKEGGTSGSVYASNWCAAARLNLGLATLGNASASYSPDRDITIVPYYGTWWYDEYSVTRGPGGVADTSGAHVGWLGKPLGAASQDANGLWKRDFQYGRVYVNLTGSTQTANTVNNYWKKISGVRDPTFNDGSGGTTYSMLTNTALFLVKVYPHFYSSWFRRRRG